MFWRMTGLSTASPVETILDKENFTLEELLEEDDIIQECKGLNGRLINFLRERAQVEQLIHFVVEEPPEDAENRRTFKLPFIACEIFTCEVDIILRTLVEDEGLMNLLFSFLEPEHSHSTLLAGYFSKVVICLLLRKSGPLMNYIQAHQEIFSRLVDLIGITSIMEVLIRLIGADELYTNQIEALQWLEDSNVLEMIVDKFRSSDCSKVHANAAETLSAISRYASPALAAKLSSPSFVGRLFCHALEDLRPKSVLVNSLSVCISLLDPKRLTMGAFHSYNRQFAPATTITANPETVAGMLGSLGDILKRLDVSSTGSVLLTTYGTLEPPLGKHRLKIIEFISVFLTIGGEAAVKELIRLRAVQRVLDLFSEYPYNNFLHHHVESIILYCLESKNGPLIDHVLLDCNLVGRILEAEKNFLLEHNGNKPTVPVDGRPPPRIGNIGHLTKLSNKLIQLGNNNSEIQAHLQENSEWVDWYTNILLRRNALENVYQWACGRPATLQDRGKDSDDEDYQDRDYDVAALANNLSQAFRYGIYNSEDTDETHGSLDRDDEDVYFDDESAEVVISSLRLGDEQESGSLFTNSNWFAFEDDKNATTLSSDTEGVDVVNNGIETRLSVGEEELVDAATSRELKPPDMPAVEPETTLEIVAGEGDKPPEWVEWRETSDVHADESLVLSNGAVPMEIDGQDDEPGIVLVDASMDDGDEVRESIHGDAAIESVENMESQEFIHGSPVMVNSVECQESIHGSPVIISIVGNTESANGSQESTDGGAVIMTSVENMESGNDVETQEYCHGSSVIISCVEITGSGNDVELQESINGSSAMTGTGVENTVESQESGGIGESSESGDGSQIINTVGNLESDNDSVLGTKPVLIDVIDTDAEKSCKGVDMVKMSADSVE